MTHIPLTTSLEWAQILKKDGLPQSSTFFFREDGLLIYSEYKYLSPRFDWYSAYTLGELIRWLPSNYSIEKAGSGQFRVGGYFDYSPENTAAAALHYFAHEGIISVKDLV